MKHKHKKSSDTIRRVSTGAGRSLAPPESPPVRSYPRAAELASDGAWAAWLQETLAAVLRPAAVAGAFGMAACSLASGSEAPLPPPPMAIAPEAPPCPIPPPGTHPPPTGASVPPTGVTLVPLPSPPAPPIEPTRTAGAVATTQLPFPPPHVPPPTQNDRRPRPQTDRQPRPHPDPMPMPGGIRPVQPPPDPPRTAGVPPQVEPATS